MSRSKKCGRQRKRRASEDVNNLSNKKRKDGISRPVDPAAPTVIEIVPVDDHQRAEKTLLKMLGGMPIHTFLSEYFEQKPLHVRNAVKGALFDSHLFSRQKMLRIMEKQPHSMSFGKDLMVCRYINSRRENFESDHHDSKATSRQVASLLDQGYSCQFYQPQRYADGLYELNAAIEEVFGCLAGASAYLTPANSQALAPHYDNVEIFVLQTQGRKKWKLYHPQVELAGEHSLDLTVDQIGEPWMELTMEKGDLLYFPRGVIHQACTDDNEFSTHVTISVYQHNSWANFLEVALPRILRQAFDSDVSFRKGLPVGYLRFMGTQSSSDSEDAKEFTAICKKLVGKLAVYVSDKSLQEAADEAAMDLIANRLPPSAKLTNKADDLGPSPLDSNVTIRFKNRSHIRLSMGEDEMKEAYVAVYFSLSNCRRHHMGLCTCDGEDDWKGKGDENERNSDDDESVESGSASENQIEEDNDSENIGGAFTSVPSQPKSIIFPGEMTPALMKLYASSTSTRGATIDELAETTGDETSVSGMLLRLWSEGLIDVMLQS
ncbi:Uncharacterized conserved protein [Plasmopara halstedii]|uniref:Bifunctional lysine-specific demethylase and histidyl-hydroxylase n=1 Tax=Plasmopara halstedii TaxID=4781 RepID=A0A0P1AGF5_PLAHL|nr:Uncharacterized conserved protein [Plasmopara halstedii]CEG39540.1 Uncharacterized conserved protein [Plasmopara halstedii]|eukprot:XP_024575909.1 Uncharacterized conserved protein [Plasmopara halstedii]